MANRRTNPEHQQAVSRRLALLSAELAGARSESEDDWSVGHTRIRPLAAAPDQDVEVGPGLDPSSEAGAEDRHGEEAGPVPQPGRHASRRPAQVVPSVVRSRYALGPAQLTVVAVVVALALAVTCWALVRGDPDQLEAPTLDPGAAASSSGAPLVGVPQMASSGAPGVGASSGAQSESVTVDVAGKVRRPGIAVLDPGSRVVDALKAAGGAKPGVDLAALNLARVLVDGEQILVGQAVPTGVAASAVPSAGATGGPLVNINTASSTELETLPQVGPVTAAAIVAWRDEHGGFSSVDELLEVDGIGDATLGQVAPYVTV